MKEWDAFIEIVDGELLAVEPRFREHDIVAPKDNAPDAYAFSSWERPIISNEIMATIKLIKGAAMCIPSINVSKGRAIRDSPKPRLDLIIVAISSMTTTVTIATTLTINSYEKR